MVFKERPRIIIFVIFSVFFLVSAKGHHDKVVYGVDDRVDLFEIKSPQWLQNSSGIAALILKKR